MTEKHSADPHVDAEGRVLYRRGAGPRNMITDSDFDNFICASA
jgi:hypothetical protein